MRYSIEEIVKHNIQLTKVELIDVDIKKYIYLETLENNKISRDITITSDSKLIDVDYGYIDVSMSINSKLGNEKYYDLFVKYRGFCKNMGVEFLENREFEYFLDVQAIKLIWPFFRELLPGLLFKMGTDVFEIPTIDVLQTIKGKIKDE